MQRLLEKSARAAGRADLGLRTATVGHQVARGWWEATCEKHYEKSEKTKFDISFQFQFEIGKGRATRGEREGRSRAEA